MSEDNRQKPRKKQQNSERENSQKIDFVYDDKWEKYLGPRTGLYFGVVNDRKHYDGYRRYSDYMTYGSISSEKEQSNNGIQHANENQKNTHRNILQQSQNNVQAKQTNFQQRKQSSKSELIGKQTEAISNKIGTETSQIINFNAQTKKLQNGQVPFVSAISTIKKGMEKDVSPIISRNSSYFKYAQLLDQISFPQDSPRHQQNQFTKKNLQFQGELQTIQNGNQTNQIAKLIKNQRNESQNFQSRKLQIENQITDNQFYLDDRLLDQIANKHKQWEQQQKRLQQGAQKLKQQMIQYNKRGRPSLLNPKIGKKQQPIARKSVKFNDIKQTKNILTESIGQQIISKEQSDVLCNLPFLKDFQQENLQKEKQMDMQKGEIQKRQFQVQHRSKGQPLKRQTQSSVMEEKQKMQKPKKSKSKFAKASQQQQKRKQEIRKKYQYQQSHQKQAQIQKFKKGRSKKRKNTAESQEQEKLIKNERQLADDVKIRYPNDQQKKNIEKQIKRNKQTKKAKKAGDFPRVKRQRCNILQRVQPQSVQSGRYQFVPLSDSQDETWDENGGRYPKRHRPGKVNHGNQKLLYKGTKLIGKLQKKTIWKQIQCKYIGIAKIQHELTKDTEDQVHGFIKIPPKQQISGVLGIHDFSGGQVSYQHPIQANYPVTVNNGLAEFDLKDKPELSPGTPFLIRNNHQKNHVKVKFVLKKNTSREDTDKQQKQ